MFSQADQYGALLYQGGPDGVGTAKLLRPDPTRLQGNRPGQVDEIGVTQ